MCPGKLKGKYVENRNNLHFEEEQEDNLKFCNTAVLICEI